MPFFLANMLHEMRKDIRTRRRRAKVDLSKSKEKEKEKTTQKLRTNFYAVDRTVLITYKKEASFQNNH